MQITLLEILCIKIIGFVSVREFLRTCGSIGVKFIYGASCIIKNVDVEN